MKITVFALCFLCLLFASTAFAQSSAPVLSNNPAPLEMSGYAQHADEHPMGQEVSLLSHSTYGYAKGELPLADVAEPVYHTPLGDVARAYRKEHANAPKAVMTLDK
jgi:hypothetical protein